uniref:Uncharacterized protein n=1 Tax=Oryza sativa subsp. japonica TaxID=39947 RepID=Q5JJR9_ORYSJ|nr:hypothetical protein [Oryza sativa Japonica Group]
MILPLLTKSGSHTPSTLPLHPLLARWLSRGEGFKECARAHGSALFLLRHRCSARAMPAPMLCHTPCLG